MMDTKRYSSSLSMASATVAPSLHFPVTHHEPDHFVTQSAGHPRLGSSPTRPSGFLARSGLSFSAHPASNNNFPNLSRAPSFSATAAKFRSLSKSKYRNRRLSHDSLTDLTPPTHPDLDQIQPLSASSIHPHELLSPSSYRSSVIFLGKSSKIPSLSQKSAKDNPSAANMSMSKAEPNPPPSFSLRLRLLATKTTPENQGSDKDGSQLPKCQPEYSSSRSHKPRVLKSIHNKVTKAEVITHQSADSDQLQETMLPPRKDFRLVVNPNYTQRPMSILNPPQISLGPALNRSSSSPNLNFAGSTFSQRPSAESIRTQNTNNSIGSPKRSRPPPPIKVPLPARQIAIAVGSESSPVVPSRIPSRHCYSNSESITHSVRRFAGVDWSTSAGKQSDVKTNVDNDIFHQRESKVNRYHDLTASSPRNVQIPISNSSLKGNKDKFPVVMPLQPAPRRVSNSHLHPSTNPKGRTLPLLISKHSRSFGNSTSLAQHRSSAGMNSEGVSINTLGSPKGAASKNTQLSKTPISSARFSQCLQSPRETLQHGSSWSPGKGLDQKPKQTHHIDSLSLAGIPFPTTKDASNLPDPIASSVDIVGDDFSHDALDKKLETNQEADQLTYDTRSSEGTQTDSVAYFDIRNFPLRLDTTTCESSGSLPSIAIPKPISIPQLHIEPKTTSEVPSVRPCTSDIVSKSASSMPTEKSRPSQQTDFSPDRSGLCNGSTELPGFINRTFTPLSNSPSNLSSGFISRATSHHSTIFTSHSPVGRKSLGLSVDDFYVNINSNVLLDFSRRKANKKSGRPRSMSDGGPARDEIWIGLFKNHKDSLESQFSSPYSADYPLSVLPYPRTHSPRSAPITTVSIEQQIRQSSPSELNKLTHEALRYYDSNKHRFIVGDVNQLVQEARQLDEKKKELQLRYLRDLRKREKLFEHHFLALRALNNDHGSRLGESLSKLVIQTDQLALELIDTIDYSAKVNRTCDSHWRAAAAVQLNTLAVKEAQLEVAQSRIEQLESDRSRQLKEISELQSKIETLQYQARPSSRATDADSIGSGSIPTTHVHLGSGSPSSTPRITHFPYNSQRHGKIVQSRMRLNSARSFGSNFTPNSHFDSGAGEGTSYTSPTEPVSPRTAFLSSYGLTHSHAQSQEPSETPSQALNKTEPRSLSPPKSNKPNCSNITTPNLPLNSLANYPRSDSMGSTRNTRGLVLRPAFPTSNPNKQQRPINGLHLKGNRCSSFGSSDIKMMASDSTNVASLAPWEVKSRSSSSFLSVPPASQSASWALQNAGSSSFSDLASTEGSSDFQQSNMARRGSSDLIAGGSSSSLSRFPRQAPPPPSLPLSSEQASRRRGDWSPECSSHGNLSSITLSQLGSMDIANLIDNLESFER